MPLSIIRNDITRVKADAIVNTANPHVAVGRGTDYAIYKAAGMEELLEARNMIGDIEPGHTAVTSAFGLDAKYIIHTVGPAWKGGSSGERETVASCYRNCLSEALLLKCESVAFPLISTGTYGFPKDEALDIAIREISEFLEDNDMDVSLVVYDSESFTLSSALFDDIKSYIDDAEASSGRVYYSAPSQSRMIDNTVRPKMSSKARSARPAPDNSIKGRIGSLFRRRNAREDEEYEEDFVLSAEDVLGSEAQENFESNAEDLLEEDYYKADAAVDEMLQAPAPMQAPTVGSLTGEVYSKGEMDDILAHLISNKDESFQQKLFHMIDARGMTDPEVYKKANIDRKLFSKIRSNVNYKPTKKTAVAFAIALGLNLDETTDLLRSAGMSLSPSNSFDIIIRYCIEHRITNIHEVNCILFKFDQVLLGA